MITVPPHHSSPISAGASAVVLPAPGGAIERKPVAFSWALDPNEALSDPAPFLAESREYWMTVEAAELQLALVREAHELQHTE